MKKTNLMVLLAFVAVLCLSLTACTIQKHDNAISGLNDITATCGDKVPALNATALYGEVSYGLAKAADGTEKENLTYGEYTGTLTIGTYYVKASVAEAEDYKAAEAYAKITVNHQAFAAIEGNGETKHETTADGKYRVWTEKKCACGETIIGNETITDKLPATIGGVADISDKCGYVVATDGITTDKGTLKFELATAVDGTGKEQLTYAELTAQPLNVGTYYLKVSVAEGDDYGAATAYAKITVTHKTYEEIDGEGTFVAPVFDTKTKGYYTKNCACGTEMHNGEFVSVKVAVDGTALREQVVEVGKNLVVPTDLPQREGYVLTLKNGESAFDFTAVQVNDFATYNLIAEYVATETRTGKISVGAGSAWMLIKGDETKLTEENVSSFEQKDGFVEVKTNFLPENVTACMQLNLGAGVLDAYHTYTFTFKASQGTSVWFGDNYDNGKFNYTDEMAAANTVVTVVVKIVDGNMIASFDGAEFNYGKTYNLNEQTLRFQDKDETLFANRGKRYVITVTEVCSTYDYLADAQAILATIPTTADEVTIENAFQLNETIALFDVVAANFSARERTAYVVDNAVREKVTSLVNDHVNIANNIIKDLPKFDAAKLADMTEAEIDGLYKTVTQYVAYVKTAFTAEELASYTESRDIAMYRYYFAGRKDVVKNVIADGKTDIIAPDFTKETSGIRVTSAGKHDVTLPAIPLAAYSEVHMYISVRPNSGCVVTTTVGEGCSFETTASSTWLEIRFSNKDGKWVVSVSAPDAYLTAPTVDVPQDVVVGNKGFTFTVEVTTGDNYNVLIDFPDANTIRGTQIALDTTVYKVEYTYSTAAGEKQATSYYLDGEQLVLPEIATTYDDEVGTHTFKGWFAGETQHNAGELVKGNLSLVAKFEVTRYNEFSVTYYQDDSVTQYGDTQTYHYGDKLTLPAEPTKVSQGTTQYAFVGWYDADGKQYKGGETITADLELTAKFNEMTVKVQITLTNLAGNDQVIDSYYAGSKFDKPVDPQRTGFVFAGWYTTDGEPYNFDALLENDGLTLVAKWYKEDNTKSVLYTNTQMQSYITNNWGAVAANDVGKGFLFDTDFKDTVETTIDANRFVGVVKMGGDCLKQSWSLPNINFNLFEKVEFVITKNGGLGTIEMLGKTLDFTNSAAKEHILFQIKDGKLNVYGINAYTAPLMSFDIPADVLSGKDAIGVVFNYESGEMHVSEIHATNKYVDPVANANAINAEFAAWCNANVGAASELTAEKKSTFANYLNKLYIARNDLTAKETKENGIEGIITYVHGELAKLADSYFDMIAATDFTYNELYRDAERDVKGKGVKNGAYEAPNAATTMDYYGYVAGGADSTGGTFTLPKINFEALGMNFSLNCAYQNTASKVKISVNNVDGGDANYLSNNLEYCFVVGIYKDAASNKWFVRLYAGRGQYDYKVQLTDAQANGQEAVTFTISLESASWFSFHISNLSATF